jgi:hypothetical protein
MALVATVVAVFPELRSVELVGTIVASSTYATPGDALDFAALAGTGGFRTLGGDQPVFVSIEGIAGFKYEYDVAAKKVKVRQSAAAGNAFTEIADGAYPAGVTGDTIRFRALFSKE